VSLGRLENTETGILVHPTGLDQRLLSHDTLTLDLEILTDRIVDQPAPPEELDLLVPYVLDTDEIGENELLVIGARPIVQKEGAHGDAHAMADPVEQLALRHVAR
jgi:hypothetical protein